MDWVQSLQQAINFIEENILEDLTPEMIAKNVYSSNAHFQRVFAMITGMTIGEYIRARRLTLAGSEIINTGSKIIDIALKYKYDSAGSFSKAFVRFHGVTPSEAKKSKKLQIFSPLSIQINVRGGFNMQRNLIANVPVIDYNGNNAAFFITLLESAMSAIGEKCDRAKLVALSGEGNRFCWETWKFGNEVTDSINETPFETEKRVLSAIGWKAKYITVQKDQYGEFINTDASQIRNDFIRSINRGFPVIIRYIHHADCDLNIFFGYENNGEKIIGYPYNNDFKVGDFTTNDSNTPTAWTEWENNLSGYILLQYKIESASERSTALSAFQFASDHFNKTTDIHGKKIGLAAWKAFLYDLEFDDFSDLSSDKLRDRFIIYCDALSQIYARTEALPYYRSLMTQFPEWQNELETAIAALEACALYGGFLWSQGFSFDEAGYEKFRNPEARKILADAGREAMRQDALAVGEFTKILRREKIDIQTM